MDNDFKRAGAGAGVFSGRMGGARNATARAIDEAERFKKTFRTNVTNAFRDTTNAAERFNSTMNRTERFMFRVTSAFRGAGRALFDTQRGVRDMDYATRKAERGLFDLAYNAARAGDNFVKSFTRMNTVATLLAPVIFLLVQTVLQLGAALVAVAAAAAQAAVALGGALLAGLMQLLPVVGLLVAAFHRLSLLLQANKLLTQQAARGDQNAASAARAHREAVEHLSDAQWSLKEAYQNVKDQALDLKIAEQSLIDVRRQAFRELQDRRNAQIDALFAEKDATLALKEAKLQLAQLENQRMNQGNLLRDRKNALEQAKRAVDIARTQGDPGQLSVALQQLGAAQSNFSAIADAQGGLQGQQFNLSMERAKLGVQEAAQRRKEAELTLSRAIQDANRAEKDRVKNAPSVVAAQRQVARQTHQLAESHRQVAKALREVRDAAYDLEHKTYAGGAGQNKALTTIMGQLSPAEKDTLKIIRDFTKLWKKVGRPLTDAIVTAFGDAILEIEKLLRDKKFMAAFQRLADVIGDQIRAFARFLTTPQQRKFFEMFTDLAAKNLPKITLLFERVLSLVERIAIAFAPVFEHILEGTNKWLGRAINRADQTADIGVRPDDRAGVRGAGGSRQTRLGAFAQGTIPMLDSVTHFIGAFFRLMGGIISVAAGPGKNALDEMAKTFDRWNKELRTTKREGATEFFARAVHFSGLILKLFGHLAAIFFKLAEHGLPQFIKFIDMIVMPAAEAAGRTYASILSLMLKIASAPGISKLLEGLIYMYLLSKITPAGMIASSTWHGLVLWWLRQIAVNTGATGILAALKNFGRQPWATALAKSPILTVTLVALAAAFGLAVGTVIQKLLPQGAKEAIGSTISKIPGLGVARGGHAPVIPESLGRSDSKSPFAYLARMFLRLVDRGVSPEDAASYVRRTHPGSNVKFGYQGKEYATGGQVGQGGGGKAVPIVAHVGEWVVNQMQQMKLARALGKPIDWIRRMLFGGRTPSATKMGGKDKFGAYRMMDNWNDQQYDAAGNMIYGGTYFVETPLGQWVQLARSTIAKMQRQPGWLPRRLLQQVGFQGATRDQIQEWGAKFYKFNAEGAPHQNMRHLSMGGVVMPSFAAGGVVATPAAVASGDSARGVNQSFEITTRSPHVDIDYVMRVAKLHAEAA